MNSLDLFISNRMGVYFISFYFILFHFISIYLFIMCARFSLLLLLLVVVVEEEVLPCFIDSSVFKANSLEPGQTPHNAASDLTLFANVPLMGR